MSQRGSLTCYRCRPSWQFKIKIGAFEIVDRRDTGWTVLPKPPFCNKRCQFRSHPRYLRRYLSRRWLPPCRCRERRPWLAVPLAAHLTLWFFLPPATLYRLLFHPPQRHCMNFTFILYLVTYRPCECFTPPSNSALLRPLAVMKPPCSPPLLPSPLLDVVYLSSDPLCGARSPGSTCPPGGLGSPEERS